MDHYIEITVKGDRQTPLLRVVSGISCKLHHALVDQPGNIGVAYPKYGTTLGNQLRLHGSQDALNQFGTAWIDTLIGFCQISEIRPIPEVSCYRNYFRVRPQKQQSKLAAGLRSGHIQDAKRYRQKMFAEILSEPFIDLYSASTDRNFRRFVGMQETKTQVLGAFDSYGQSKQSTVPHF